MAKCLLFPSKSKQTKPNVFNLTVPSHYHPLCLPVNIFKYMHIHFSYNISGEVFSRQLEVTNGL